MSSIIKKMRTPVVVTIVLVLLCGIIYPLLVTLISQIIFPHQANGSIIKVGDTEIGSEIVGQDFTDPRFMKSRPSAVNYNTYTQSEQEEGIYNGVASGSNNYAPSNPDLIDRVEKDMQTFLKENPSIKKEDIPTDLLTASGSGLDPHISPESASVQIPALQKSTGLSKSTLKQIIDDNTNDKVLGIFGEETVNVLKVNIDIAKEIGMIK